MKLVLLLYAILISPALLAEAERSTNTELNGTELQYTYEDGAEVILAFYDDKLKFEWIAGPFKGTKRQDLPYQSRRIDNGVYLINWHDVGPGSFPTLYIDIPSKRVFGSAIIGYRSDEPFVLFDAAKISRVELPR